MAHSLGQCVCTVYQVSPFIQYTKVYILSFARIRTHARTFMHARSHHWPIMGEKAQVDGQYQWTDTGTFRIKGKMSIKSQTDENVELFIILTLNARM